ncbi:TPA: ribose-5-phosphate isomerase [Candidatus Dependentiae bacterium]|nr:MAG: Ribose 5-phosphate isomerase B [candidate division TM6 bacterium GW2011_GWE2_31_21]KKP53621.1 MAG: Ribose 5-phosphate isomerase B [candidate division TM6 bacterium GW2011_GWF2_33_332]HBS48139.1 ribose-5-phosphate isomerase [Candidatus Dependentiae bacterium]HBZ73563.1 ribose-5-phosphate isomerase [Candidatus Dependentiae bacterium]
MKISIGCDHRGFELKEFLKIEIIQKSKELFADNFAIAWSDIGAFNDTRSDYPLFAQKVCKEILDKKADFGILICGSGVGMSIAANRFKKIYAALCWNEQVAKLVVCHDGANVLVLPSDFVSKEEALKIISIVLKEWHSKKNIEKRYKDRLKMIESF